MLPNSQSHENNLRIKNYSRLNDVYMNIKSILLEAMRTKNGKEMKQLYEEPSKSKNKENPESEPSTQITTALNNTLDIQREFSTFHKLVVLFENQASMNKPLNYYLYYVLKTLDKLDSCDILKEHMQAFFDYKLIIGLLQQIYDSYRKYYFAFEEFDEWEYLKVREYTQEHRKALFSRYNATDSQKLIDIFDSKDATNILLLMNSLWPSTTALLLQALVELWEEKRINNEHNYFFNKDLNDLCSIVIASLNRVSHTLKTGSLVKKLIEAVVYSENYISMKFMQTTWANNVDFRFNLIKKLLLFFDKGDCPSSINPKECIFKFVFQQIFKKLKRNKKYLNCKVQYYERSNEYIELLLKLYDYSWHFSFPREQTHNYLLQMTEWALQYLSVNPLNTFANLLFDKRFMSIIFIDSQKINSSLKVVINNLSYILPYVLKKEKEIGIVSEMLLKHSMQRRSSLELHSSCDLNEYDCKQLDNVYKMVHQKLKYIIYVYRTKLKVFNNYNAYLIWTNVNERYEEKQKLIQSIKSKNYSKECNIHIQEINQKVDITTRTYNE